MYKLIVGLGNKPCKGNKSYFHGTRHNTGSDFLLFMAESEKVSFDHYSSQDISFADLGYLHLGMAETNINNSGHYVASMLNMLQLSANDLFVVVDDVELLYGQWRVRTGSSAKGHNGVRDIMTTLKTHAFTRLCIGVDKKQPLRNYVLERHTYSQQRQIEAVYKVIFDDLKMIFDDLCNI